MPVVRPFVRVAPIALLGALAVAPTHGPAAAPDPSPGSQPTEVEVRYIDDSTMKLKILDDRLELVTKYGLLQIPLSDVRRIEFGSRVPPDVAEKVAAAIVRLGHPDFQSREAASAELRGYRERAYLPLLKALKHQDPEVSRRAEEALRFLQAKLPPSQLEPKEFDVIHTEDSKFTGKLTATSVRVLTFQFGEQTLRLADLRTLRSAAGVAADELSAAGPAPPNLSAYQNQFGKEMAFAVTGTQGTGPNSGVWGTDVYTLDSNIAAAAVHAGQVQPGQTGVVRVRVVQSPPQFVGSFRNGISSAPYGNYPTGAYEFVKK
jgi:hypothetical protein